MALLTIMDGIPLYSTIQEAIAWATSNGLNGYHEHVYKEQLGYMGGTDHAAAIAGPIIVATPVPMPTPMPTTPTTPTTPATPATPTTPAAPTGGTGGGGTGGGGGGY